MTIVKVSPLVGIGFALAACLILGGCAGIAERGGAAIEGVVRTWDGKPVPNVEVRVSYKAPGGFLSTPRERKLGPYRTDAEGRFTIPAHDFIVVAPGFIFSGDTRPRFSFQHPSGASWFTMREKLGPDIEVFTAPGSLRVP